MAGDGGYGDKVMREFQDLYRVAKGKPLPGNFDVTPRLLTAQAKPAAGPAAHAKATPAGSLGESAAERARALSYVDPVAPGSERLASAEPLANSEPAVRKQ
jgi:hypothetical protein